MSTPISHAENRHHLLLVEAHQVNEYLDARLVAAEVPDGQRLAVAENVLTLALQAREYGKSENEDTPLDGGADSADQLRQLREDVLRGARIPAAWGQGASEQSPSAPGGLRAQTLDQVLLFALLKVAAENAALGNGGGTSLPSVERVLQLESAIIRDALDYATKNPVIKKTE
jgi:hypothetical protein